MSNRFEALRDIYEEQKILDGLGNESKTVLLDVAEKTIGKSKNMKQKAWI